MNESPVADTAAAPPLPSLLMRRPNLDNLPPLDLPVGYNLRAFREADLEGLAALLQAAFPELVWDTDRVRRDLLDDATVQTVLVIEHSSVLVATASVRLMPDTHPGSGYVHWVGTHPNYRGARLGYLVTAATLHEFVRLGCHEAILETDDFRLPAIKTYLRLGFVPEMRHESHAPRWEKLAPQLAAPAR